MAEPADTARELAEKLVLAGVGAVALTAERADALCTQYIIPRVLRPIFTARSRPYRISSYSVDRLMPAAFAASGICSASWCMVRCLRPRECAGGYAVAAFLATTKNDHDAEGLRCFFGPTTGSKIWFFLLDDCQFFLQCLHDFTSNDFSIYICFSHSYIPYIYQRSVGSVVPGAELGREDHGSIPRNAVGRGLKP